MEDLKTILISYGNSKFESDFNFSYSGDKSNVPDGLGTPSALICGIENLGNFPDTIADTSTIGALLDGLIFRQVFI